MKHHASHDQHMNITHHQQLMSKSHVVFHPYVLAAAGLSLRLLCGREVESIAVPAVDDRDMSLPEQERLAARECSTPVLPLPVYAWGRLYPSFRDASKIGCQWVCLVNL